MINKNTRRQKRKTKIRSKIRGTEDRPRLVVYRSNVHIYAQLIDDSTGKTIASVTDQKITKGTKSERAKVVGGEIAKIATTKKIAKVVFDRSGYRFHGRIKDLAQGAREGGLIF